jgi:hypothetical protein
MTFVRWLSLVSLSALGCTPFQGGAGSGTAESTGSDSTGVAPPMTGSTSAPPGTTTTDTNDDLDTGSTSLVTTAADGPSTSATDSGEPEPFFRREITIHGDQIPDGEPLADFTVLVGFAGDEGITHVDYGGHVLDPDAADFLFRDAALQPIAHERVSYAPDTGRMSFWVRVPEVAPDVDTTFWLDYGAPSLVGASPQGAWNDAYVGVWHFEDTVIDGGDILDSSPAGNDGMALAMDAADGVTGRVGQGLTFTQDNATVWIGNGALDLPGPITFEGWGRMEGQLAMSGYQRLFNKGGALIRPLSFWVSDPTDAFGQAAFVVNYEEPVDYVELLYYVPAFDYGQWHHYAGVVGGPGGDVALFVDGVRVQSTTYAYPIETGHPNFYIGNWDMAGETRRWVGVLDELRFSDVARSDAWIEASYRAQATPQMVCTIGPEQAMP